jgi:hypothetical protein
MNRPRPRRRPRPRPRLVGAQVPPRIDSLSGRIKAHRVLDKLKQPESNDHETCPSPPKVFDALTRL